MVAKSFLMVCNINITPIQEGAIMLYLSKGLKLSSTGLYTHISHCGITHVLSNTSERLWLNGQYACAETKNEIEEWILNKMTDLGVAVSATASDDLSAYRVLTNCVICPVKLVKSQKMLDANEKYIWKWIKKAGFMLTASELVFLTEKEVTPESAYLGKKGWQKLIERIYTTETIPDNVLDNLMESSPAMKQTVDAIIGLLSKKRIYLV